MQTTLTFCDECNFEGNIYKSVHGTLVDVPREVGDEVSLLEGKSPTVVVVGGCGNHTPDGYVPVSRGVFPGTRDEAAAHGWRQDDSLDICTVCIAEENVGINILDAAGHDAVHGANPLTDFLTKGDATQVQNIVMLKSARP
jgi:hypothetical protein